MATASSREATASGSILPPWPLTISRRAEANRAQRPHDALEDCAVGGEIQADRAAERQMMLATSPAPDRRQHRSRHLAGCEKPGGARSKQFPGDAAVGADRQVRPVLLQRADRQYRQRALACGNCPQLRRGHARPFDFKIYGDLPGQLDFMMV